MIKRIVHFALHEPLFILLGLVLFVGVGISAFRSLPIEAFPDVTDTQVTVITLFPGRAPEEVEKQVTIPLEIALAGVPNSIRMFSHTQFGLSFIVVTFDEKPSLFMARQLVEERLRGLDLPPGVEPELAPPATATGEIFRYRVVAPGSSPPRYAPFRTGRSPVSSSRYRASPMSFRSADRSASTKSVRISAGCATTS